MKTLLIPIALALALFTMTACSPSLPGGYSRVSVSEKSIVEAAAFAITKETEILKATDPKSTLELLSVVSAEHQVVAGANYRMTLRVRHDGKEKEAQATVWWQAWRTPDPYQLSEWLWR